jgi:hypothetical protein
LPHASPTVRWSQRHPFVAPLALVVLGTVSSAAIDLDITPDDVDRAIAIGSRGEPGSSTFHAAYVRKLDFTADAITVQQVEVITPYRRIVLHAEARRRIGDYVVGRADVEPLLREWRSRVSVVTTVRFHPQNVLTSLPPIEAQVRDPIVDRPIASLDVVRKPITKIGTNRPLLGSTIETVFDAGLLANVNGTIAITLRDKELARTVMDFRAIE